MKAYVAWRVWVFRGFRGAKAGLVGGRLGLDLPTELSQEIGVPEIPKCPCTYIVYTWALKLLCGNPFKAQLHRYMGFRESYCK